MRIDKKLKIIGIIVLILVLSMQVYSEILNFGAGHVVAQCPANAPTCGCNDYSGGVLRCDNSDFADTLESSSTIDTCTDGSGVTPSPDYPDQSYFYEYVQDISREDLNGTPSNPYEGGLVDSQLRIGDDVKISVTFVCTYGDDSYVILYKNSTNSVDSDWQLLESGNCQATSNSESITIETTKTTDRIVGNHTIRAAISYSSEHPEATCGSQFDDPDYQDTDDLVIEVTDSLDTNPPQINVLSPAAGSNAEITDGMIVNVRLNVTDQTGVDKVKLNLSYNNLSFIHNLTNISKDIYEANLSNLTFLGIYNITFYANDTVINNASSNTLNHINNYTTTHFYVTNNFNINILSPVLNKAYGYPDVVLNFFIGDNQTPYNEVYYTLNSGARTVLNESTYTPIGLVAASNFSNNESNLTQSFRLQNTTRMDKVGLMLKKTGLPIDADVLLIENSSQQVIARGVVDSSLVSSIDFEYLIIQLNQSFLANNTKTYNILLNTSNTTDYYSWQASADAYADGEFLSNNSYDLMTKVYDLYRYNATLSGGVEGINRVTVCENDSINIIECSFADFTIDLASPFFGSINFDANPDLGTAIDIYLDAYDLTSLVDSAMINIDGQNHNMTFSSSITGGKRFRYRTNTFNNISQTYYFNFTINDSAGNLNYSQTYNLTVVDKTSPNIISFNITTINASYLDPFVELNVTANYSDLSNISNITLSYKLSNNTIWNNKTMNVTKGFIGNISFDSEGVWEAKLLVKDIYNNTGTSSIITNNVTYERTWHVDPLTFSDLQIPFGSTLEFMNYSVFNTGDLTLNFSIRSIFDSTYNGDLQLLIYENDTLLQSTDSFEVLPESSATILVDARSLNTDEKQILAKNNVSCNTPSCAVNAENVGATIYLGDVGPTSIISLFYYYPQEDETINDALEYFEGKYLKINSGKTATLYVEIENIAQNTNFTANNVSFSWNFPNTSATDVIITNFSVLNTTISQLNSSGNGNKYTSFVNITMPSSAANYSFNFTINSHFTWDNGTDNISRNYSKLVYIKKSVIRNDANTNEDVSTSAPSEDPESPVTPPSLSGGNGPAGAAGLGVSVPDVRYNLSVTYPKIIQIERGKSISFIVEIRNLYKTKSFYETKLSLIGYPITQMKYEPAKIGILDFNQTERFNITITNPVYMASGVKKAKLILEYYVLNTGTNLTNNDTDDVLRQELAIDIVIGEVSKEDSLQCIAESEQIIKNMTEQNISTNLVKEKLLESKKALASLDFTQVKTLCNDIKTTYEDAQTLINEMKLVTEKIESAKLKGYDMKNAEDLLNITLQSFIEGDFMKTAENLEKTKTTTSILINSYDSKFINKLKSFIKNYWIHTLIFIILTSLITSFALRQAHIKNIKEKIRGLQIKQKNLEEDLKKLQHLYYEEKTISKTSYDSLVEKDKSELADIQKQLINLTSKNTETFKLSKDASNLEKNETEIIEQIKKLQTDFYVNKTLDKETFEKMSTEHKKHLSETRKQIIIQKHKAT